MKTLLKIFLIIFLSYSSLNAQDIAKKDTNNPFPPKQIKTKIYRAILTQEGTSDPKVVSNGFFENTLGNIVWERKNNGQYVGTLKGAFPLERTWLYVSAGNTIERISLRWSSEDTVSLISTQFVNGGWYAADDLIYYISVEIIVGY